MENKLENKICIVCCKSFTPTTKCQKICSDKCRKIRHSQDSKLHYIKQKAPAPKRICRFCGKEFIQTCHNRLYCSDNCKIKAKYRQQQEYFKRKKVKRGRKPNSKEALCWTCQNACGGCSWSRNLIPVEGWKAKEIKNASYSVIKSYKVIECPEFEEGR